MGLSPDVAIARILDANLDRAREGMRVLEEWCRFGLNDRHWSEVLKEARQQLGQHHSDDLRSARDTAGDVGTALTHPQEAQRHDIRHLLTVNLSRVQEALRVLEEYAKIARPALALTAKSLRYQVYVLESFLLGQPYRDRLSQAQLYLVTSPHDRLETVVEAAIAGGVQIVQYRDKEGENGQRLMRAQALRDCCRRHDVLFLVNDHVDLALAVDADGVHLGQKDLPIGVARHLLGSQKIIGRSTTNPEELAKALAEGADYVGVGPIYATPTKPGRAPAGLTYARHALAHCPIPWFAIGGIDLAHLSEVMVAGVRRVAVVREIMNADDPAAISGQFRHQLASPPAS